MAECDCLSDDASAMTSGAFHDSSCPVACERLTKSIASGNPEQPVWFREFMRARYSKGVDVDTGWNARQEYKLKCLCAAGYRRDHRIAECRRTQCKMCSVYRCPHHKQRHFQCEKRMQHIDPNFIAACSCGE